jgi:hypothetical protein
MRKQQEAQPLFEFRAAEGAGTAEGWLDILCDILIDIEESKKAEQAQAEGDKCQKSST